MLSVYTLLTDLLTRQFDTAPKCHILKVIIFKHANVHPGTLRNVCKHQYPIVSALASHLGIK